LTSFPGFEHAPVFSPDGRKVLFVWKSTATNTLHIYYKVIGGSERVRVTDSKDLDFSPSWSPNGESLHSAVPARMSRPKSSSNR
jgi:Tol biopolymer transport system component